MKLDKHALEEVREKEAIVQRLVDNQQKFDLIMEIGDIWHNELGDDTNAIIAYEKAVEIKPDDLPSLHKLMPLYQSLGRYHDLINVITRVAGMEEDAERRAAFYFTIGVIYRDELNEPDEAVGYFNLSLDCSYENLKAFEAIERILTEVRDWDGLVDAYRRQLDRLEGQGRIELELNTWYFLGELFRTRLNDRGQAVDAYEKALELDPESVKCREALAVLYIYMPNRVQDSVHQCHWLICRDPSNVDYYKSLFKLYHANKDFDKAWCLASTLVFMGKADANEQRFFQQHRRGDVIQTGSRLGNEHWLRDLFHPEESVYIGKILEAVTKTARKIKIQPASDFGLKKRHRRTANDDDPFVRTFFYCSQILNFPEMPELYVQKDSHASLQYAITEPMASVCGANFYAAYTYPELMFLVGTHLTYYCPEHYIRWVLPATGELGMLLLAAIIVAAPEFTPPEDETGVLEQYVNLLDATLEPVDREYLSKVVGRFVKTGELIDVDKWIRCVELTSYRVGFLLCNDLEVAVRMIRSESGTMSDIPSKEKIQELILFSISEEYFRLREQLGIAIQG